MENSAILKNENHIQLQIFGYFNQKELDKVRLYEDGKFISTCKLEKFFSSNKPSSCTCVYAFSHKIVCGKEYVIFDKLNRTYNLDVSYLANLPEFEKKYFYNGQLGAICDGQKTIFRVFSPLSSMVSVKVFNKDGSSNLYPLKRNENGVFEGTLLGNHHLKKYTYYLKINGEIKETIDPYCLTCDTNSQKGYIINLKALEDIPLYKENLSPIKNKSSISIYECNVRDMTSLTKFNNKGTYQALSSEGLTYKGIKVGVDYIKDLGVSHVQLLPIYDFQTIADDFPFSSYNWGYDPKLYFALEGSYSLNPEDGLVRMREFKNLVSVFHKNGIRVNIDVVFNHVFDTKKNALSILCPNYYFRKNEDGSYANATGCGNELETRKPMLRKLILDNISFFMDVYGIDGFRFDLMGLIDCETMLEVTKLAKKKDPNCIIYGEGWDMNSLLPSKLRTSLPNATKLENISFFNDRFRDVVRGKNFFNNMLTKGYLTGDISYIDGFKHVFSSCLMRIAFDPLFTYPYQSLNYVECHDDATLYDKLYYIDSNLERTLKRVKLINLVTILANGITFIHMGQEFGQSKNGISNTYNAGDKLNGFNFETASSRKDLIKFTKDALAIKKEYKDFNLTNFKQIMSTLYFENIDGGGILIRYIQKNRTHLYLFINPTENDIMIDVSKNINIIFDENGRLDKPYLSDGKIILKSISALLGESAK